MNVIIRVNSHRASDKLDRAIGRHPAILLDDARTAATSLRSTSRRNSTGSGPSRGSPKPEYPGRICGNAGSSDTELTTTKVKKRLDGDTD